MKIVIKSGDILENNTGIIVHGCNAQGKMGSGLAKQIADKYPNVFTDYIVHLNNCKEHCVDVVGSSRLTTIVTNKLYILSAITQFYYGRTPGVLYADKLAIRYAIQTAISKAVRLNLKDVHMPRIGTGLGGLKLNDFYDIFLNTCIHNSTKEITINLYIGD